jgi:hypothetical protein
MKKRKRDTVLCAVCVVYNGRWRAVIVNYSPFRAVKCTWVGRVRWPKTLTRWYAWTGRWPFRRPASSRRRERRPAAKNIDLLGWKNARRTSYYIYNRIEYSAQVEIPLCTSSSWTNNWWNYRTSKVEIDQSNRPQTIEWIFDHITVDSGRWTEVLPRAAESFCGPLIWGRRWDGTVEDIDMWSIRCGLTHKIPHLLFRNSSTDGGPQTRYGQPALQILIQVQLRLVV